MDNILYTALERYFKTLSIFGYYKYDDVYKLIYLSSLLDIVKNNIDCLSKEDTFLIKQAINNISGNSCLIPFSGNCDNNKLEIFKFNNPDFDMFKAGEKLFYF